MDMKEKFDQIAEKVQSDPEIMAKFKENPVGAAEEILGVDLPDEAVKGMIENLKDRMEGVDFGEILHNIKGSDDKTGEEHHGIGDLLNKVKEMF